MSLARTAVFRPVLTTVIVLAFVVLGLSSFQRLVVDLLPKVEFPFVTVTTVYPGAGPEEVESQVTEKLEEAVATLANVRRLDSINRESLSLLLIEFELGADVDLVSIDVKEKIEEVLAELPEAVDKPQVVKFDMEALPILSFSLTGPGSLRDLYDLADRRVRDELSRADGVASVTIVGGRKREIQILLDPDRLSAHGLDAAGVTQAVLRENLSVPAGRVERPATEYTLRVLGEFTDLDEIRMLPIPLALPGKTVPLGDLGRVVDAAEDVRDLALADGRNAVGIFVQKRTDANTVATAQAIRDRVERLNAQLPPETSLAVIRDNSTFISGAVRDVLINIFLGILLTTIILYLFLHDIRTTLVAALAMPTSIVATFILIDFAGFTINVMTLLALGISIGTLVANAIVVLESIARRIQTTDEDGPTAATAGTNQVAVAVAATALTNIVVFTPIAFMGGIVGQFFIQFGLTVVFATVFSLLVSFTLTPMLAARLLGRPRAAKPGAITRAAHPFLALARAWERGYRRVEAHYARSVRWSLAHRGRTALAVLAAFAGCLMLFAFVGGEFFPQSDDGFIQVLAKLPAGTTMDRTLGVMEEIQDVVRREIPETEALLLTVGGQNRDVDEGEITIRLVELKRRERGIQAIINGLRPALAGIPAADIVVQIGGGFGDEKAIVVEVLGPELDGIEAVADSIRTIMRDIPGLVDVDVSAKPGKPELVFRPDRGEMAERLVSLARIGGELRNRYEGSVASVFREGGEEFDIRVRMAESERTSLAGLERVRLADPAGAIPLPALGRIEQRRGPAEITRKNKERMVSVSANLSAGTLVEKVNAIQAGVAALRLPPGYHVQYSGEFERLGETFTEIYRALILAVVLTYLVLAAILESFVHPFTIMFTLPLGLAGVALSLFFTGATINIFSLMAMVMLVGIVVNNAILILDQAAALRRNGATALEAIAQAAPERLRPIVMTTLAILAGILPQALGGAGAAYTVAMAVVTMGGVLVSGALSLYVIPILYTVFDRFTPAGRSERAAAA